MSDALMYVQNQILNLSMKEQLFLLAYIANNINKQKTEKSKTFVRKAGIGKDPEFYMSPDFDEPLEDFAENGSLSREKADGVGQVALV